MFFRQCRTEEIFHKREIQRNKLSPIGDIKCDHYRAKNNFFNLIVFRVINLIRSVKHGKAKTAGKFQVLIGFTPSREHKKHKTVNKVTGN